MTVIAVQRFVRQQPLQAKPVPASTVARFTCLRERTRREEAHLHAAGFIAVFVGELGTELAERDSYCGTSRRPWQGEGVASPACP